MEWGSSMNLVEMCSANWKHKYAVSNCFVSLLHDINRENRISVHVITNIDFICGEFFSQIHRRTTHHYIKKK